MMRLGWRIFLHSVRQILGNAIPTVRLSMGPLAVVWCVIIVMDRVLTRAALDQGVTSVDLSVGLVIPVLISIGLVGFALTWFCVAWHRFVLLAEYPGPFGAMPSVIWMGRYLGELVRIIQLLLLVGLFGLLGIAVFAPILTNPYVQPIAALIIQTIILTFLFRLTLSLPAAAVGKMISAGEALKITRMMFYELVLVAGLTAVPANIAVFLILVGPNLIADTWTVWILLAWAVLVLSLSIVTTLYGVCVERRQLS